MPPPSTPRRARRESRLFGWFVVPRRGSGASTPPSSLPAGAARCPPLGSRERASGAPHCSPRTASPVGTLLVEQRLTVARHLQARCTVCIGMLGESQREYPGGHQSLERNLGRAE